MSALGRITFYSGDAPDPGGPPAVNNPTEVAFDSFVQQFGVKNNEDVGGSDLHYSVDGTTFHRLLPRESWSVMNVRLGRILVRSATAGSTAAYELFVVET